jgi:hypothetical protein
MEGYPIRVNEKQEGKKSIIIYGERVGAFLNDHAFAVGEKGHKLALRSHIIDL